MKRTARATPRVKGNRLVETKRRVDAETSVATYAYLGDNRRGKKVVTNCGTEHLAGDGGNTTVEYYYDRGWRIVETRNGSNQATAQYVWGTQYTDELVMVDINGDATESNDCNPDDQAGESTADERYFYHQDRNWNVVAISEYDTGDTNNGRIVERYSYTPYGQFVVLAGDSGSGELGNPLPTCTVGNSFAHQGLPFDHEKRSYQNRFREYARCLQRFAQRDPIGYSEGVNLYITKRCNPLDFTDSLGLQSGYECKDRCGRDRTCPNCAQLCGGGDWGVTACDGRTPCCCVCWDNIIDDLDPPGPPGDDPRIVTVAGICIQAHEQYHLVRTNCRNPPGPPPNECGAYGAEMVCMTVGAGRSDLTSCSRDPACKQNLAHYIDRWEARCNQQCGDANRCRILANKIRDTYGIPSPAPLRRP